MLQVLRSLKVQLTVPELKSLVEAVQKTMPPKIVLDFLRLIIMDAVTIMGPSQTRRSALNCGKVQGNALKLSKGS